MFNDISFGTKDNEEECVAHAKVVSVYMQGNLVQDNGHSLDAVPKRTGILWKRTVHKESVTISRKRCCWNSQRADILFSEQQLHYPGVFSRAKDTENCRFKLLPLRTQLRLSFRIIVSANQLSLYGPVAEMCEECESLHDRSGRPDAVMGHSIVTNEIKIEVPLVKNDPAYQNFLLQLYEERIERL